MDRDHLQERCEAYLTSLIGSAAETAVLDPTAPFGEIGINSFQVLKILKRLEEAFGALPKTLLFEHFNIRDLAGHLVERHAEVLRGMFGTVVPVAPAAPGIEPPRVPAAPVVEPAALAAPALLPCAQLDRYPQLAARRRALIDAFGNESSVSRGTALIAPWLFFGEHALGYFNCGRSGDLLLAYGYTGPAEHFPLLAEQLHRHCVEAGLQFNLFAEQALPDFGATRFSATPFGVMQRVTELAAFTLDGQKMRRLRYLVSKFEKLGECRTDEYVCGSDPDTATAIAAVIDAWCANRTMVNPLVHVVRREVLAGTLDRSHRLFLTRLDGVLQNVILVTPMAGGDGYLMDLEFYGAEMPLGGLEFAIVNIIRTLVAEGCRVFSLGGTYGVKLGEAANADPAIEQVLDGLHQQGIFNDGGNLQFKNKFRPQNSEIFLCRAVDAGRADNVLDIIMMIADPVAARADAGEAECPAPARPAPAQPVAIERPVACANPAHPRAAALAAAGFNPQNLDAGQVRFDLATDSWAQLALPAIERQMEALIGQLQRPLDIAASLRETFPFAHCTLTRSGRAAEDLFCQAWENKGRVPQNLLFPSTLLHQIDKGFEPVELPAAAAFGRGADAVFRGELDLDRLRDELAAHAGQIAYVCIELANNASGGGAVSLGHLRQVRALLAGHSIPLVLDATRLLENALAIIEHEPEWREASLWQVATALLAEADAVVASLAKDFCVNRGGLIATNDGALHDRLQQRAQRSGLALDAIDRKCVALSLQNRRFIEVAVRRRVAAVRALREALRAGGVPVVCSAPGHCLLIDVKQLPDFRELAAPVAAFVAWLYLATGVRAGAHSVGMQQQSPLNGLVRLAVPVGLADDELDAVRDALLGAFADRRDIPDLRPVAEAGSQADPLHARHRVERWLRPNVAAPDPAAKAMPIPVAHDAPAPSSTTAAPTAAPASSATSMLAAPDADMEIAIVGMAGRFPKARGMQELWENLAAGRDCIDQIPEWRYLRRRQREALGRYRGGFIDDIDRFDSLFFNISPREAETLDPQERLFLEVAWEALEDAGYYPEAFQQEELGERRIGVFVGAVWAMYQNVGAEERLAGNRVVASSFLWSIANRVSYSMNFTGPSIAVDTACSASLTAIHVACDAIRRGECAAAIVGGVNLDAHQCKQEITVAGGLLSEDGLCRAFGRGASGYVPGEGVGALLLKPLAQARRDRDNIHAVIRGTAVNHGGRNSGYAVPNPKAQCEVVSAALAKAGIDARSIGYIEAHGTGTELGDPIEIAGLNQAFRKDGVALQSCRIGSIKSNIGHLEAAAGIAGVCKVLLQMRHRQLVPSLHAAQTNEFIDFAASPFVVQQQLEPWLPRAVDGLPQPLRAGVSSFGAGGSNAHVILEALPIASEPDLVERDDPATERVFPLSARNEEQLRQAAARLQAFLERERERGSAPSLDDVAFTLQVGRKSFDHRAAIVAGSVDQLIARLQGFIDNVRDEQVVVGQVKNADAIAKLLSRSEREAFIELLAQSRDPLKLARLWIEGLLPDWQGMQPHARGRRISLPTYPFADKRHWLGEPVASNVATAGVRSLHPLIDSNESTFERQVFRKVFTDREFFIYDHLVSDIPTLPGVAYLDLARRAGELAAGRPVRRIRNILWVSPLAVRDAVPNEAFIELKPAGDAVQFEVYSERDGGTRQPYCQGKLHYAAGAEAADEFIDLQAIRARCAKVIDGADAYPLFRQLGLGLGPSFQALSEVHRNPDAAFEVLGSLQIPSAPELRFDEFVLHPSLVDSAFQAAMAARLSDAGGEMFVPYSLGEVEILHPLTPTCYSYVTEARDDKRASSNLSKMNVLIVDEQGRVLVRVRDSVGVPLLDVHAKPAQAEATRPATPAPSEPFETLYYAADWHPLPLAPAPNAPAARTLVLFAPDRAASEDYRRALGDAPTVVITVLAGDRFVEHDPQRFSVDPGEREDFVRLLGALQGAHPAPLQLCFAWPALPLANDGGDALVSGTDAALRRGVYAFLHLAQAIIAQKAEADLRLQLVYFSRPGEPQPHNDALQGFVTILRAESPRLACQVIEFVQANPTFDRAVVSALAAEGSVDNRVLGVRYQGGERLVRRIEACAAPADGQGSIRQHGTYLITGGAGGLGLLFADHLATHYQARLLLTGRSAITPELAARFDAWRAIGADVHYEAADVAVRADVERLLQTCRERFGALHGVIHSAGVLRDAYLRNKTRDEMRAVFAPKIAGTLLLDELTRAEPLDFFVCFSSLAALAGNAGQADYSYANAWMDAFAARRDAQVRAGISHGKSLSLNWSIWAEGGMRLDEQTATFFERNLGIRPLEREVGIDALMRGLAGTRSQLAVVQGVRAKIERAWGIGAAATAPAAAPASAAASDVDLDTLAKAAQQTLSRIVMEFLKLDPDDVDLDKILLDLGFDSIGLTSFSNLVNDTYGLDVTPVLFFEYPSIREIAGFLASEHRAELAAVHGGAGPARTDATPATTPVGASTEPLQFAKKWNAEPTAAAGQPSAGSAATASSFAPERRFIERPIAIVGMSGVMPQADTLEEFWAKLSQAENTMVTLVPPDRWSWEDCYGDPMVEKNKTLAKWGGFMREVDKFDPLFWGISPREAEMMDPQQRIFLESVWAAIEDSGHRVSDLAGTRTGLFVGAATRDYIDLMAAERVDLDGYSASGTSHAVLVNRISFLLDLHGPSAPLDTACSSSLVALHRAIESIHTGSCDMAIVGGVQVMLTPAGHISFGAAGMLADDGKCKTFDARANGYVRGEGSGAIFIKPLDRALADGDHIYALVRSTAENHGGKATMLTAPNPNAQAELLVEAYEKAEIDPRSVGFLECHGTGTSLGDPIEVQAMKKAFADLYRKRQLPPPTTPHIGLTSVKTNIGHLETAAGIAGILKVLLSIKHRQIPALLHFDKLNPYINLDKSPFYPVDRTRDWTPALDDAGRPYPRRAGVSSFGFGGANVHIVLEEFPAPLRAAEALPPGPHLILLSAKHDDRLRAYAARLLTQLGRDQQLELADIAYTLQVGRDAMSHRLGLVVASKEELAARLQAFVDGDAALAEVRLATVRRKPEQAASADADAIAGWLERRELEPLLEQWLAGQAPDWSRLYAGYAPQRVALATYPFARERYWFSVDPSRPKATANQQAVLHPLLHRNVSVFGQQSFVSEFGGDPKPLRGVCVRPEHGLPTMLPIELARLAIIESLPRGSAADAIELRGLRFGQGGAFAGERLRIDLYPDGADAIELELFAGAAQAEADLLVFEASARHRAIELVERIDIAALKKQFRERRRDADAVHEVLQRGGWSRDQLPRGLGACLVGDGQLLIEFALEQAAPTDAFDLDELGPLACLSLAHAACLGLLADSVSQARPATLTGIDRVHWFAGAAAQGFIWVRLARGVQPQQPRLGMDVDVTDREGRVLLKLKGVQLDNPASASIQQLRSEAFDSLLDALYDAPLGDPQADDDRSAGAEFHRILDGIY